MFSFLFHFYFLVRQWERLVSKTVGETLHVDAARSNAARVYRKTLHVDAARNNVARVYRSSFDFERGVAMHADSLFPTAFNAISTFSEVSTAFNAISTVSRP